MTAGTFFEMNSFLGKFTQLCDFGLSASLTFKNHHGKINAILEAGIGLCNSPQLSSNQMSSNSRKNVKPSQVRRRNKRKAAHSNTSSSDILNSNILAADKDGIDETTDETKSSRSIDVLAQDDEASSECFIDFDQGSHILVTEHDHTSESYNSALFNQQECITTSKNTTDDPGTTNSVNDTSQPNVHDSLSTATPEQTSEVFLTVNQNEFLSIYGRVKKKS